MELDVASKLKELAAAEEAEHPNPFPPDFEEMVISYLLDLPVFAEKHIAKLHAALFTRPETQTVIAGLTEYFKRYSTIPTREALRLWMAKFVTEDQRWEEIFRLVARKSDAREMPFVKDEISTWLRKQQSNAIFRNKATLDAMEAGDFSALRSIIDAAEIGDEAVDDFGFVDAKALLKEEIVTDWLIEDILVSQQAFVMGGKKKCLKTGLLCDMAVSLATGTPFLGKFKIPTARKVAFFSSESGRGQIQQRLAAVIAAKGVELPDGYLKTSFERPRLSNAEDLARIKAFIQRDGTDVVMVDPLYLTLLSGGAGDSNAGNLYSMGAIFGAVADTIINSGATPVLCHHFKKTVGGDSLDLDNLTMVGAAEFARQSLLIARRGGEYLGTRNNQLVIQSHGYAMGDRYNVHIDEGTKEKPNWAVTVELEQATQAREHAEKASKPVIDLIEAVVAISTERQCDGVMKEDLKRHLHWNGDKVRVALESAKDLDLIEEFHQGPRRLFRLSEQRLSQSVAEQGSEGLGEEYLQAANSGQI